MEPKVYQKLWVHREMLLDDVRCKTYRNAIYQTVNAGDIVLDIGAGTGILSMFAVQAGAGKVYAIEKSAIAEFAREIITKNGMQDQIQIIQEDMDQVRLPEKIDVIVAEWMGGFGVDENLLATVLNARDQWLKPDGKMLPEKVTARIALVFDEKFDHKLTFWYSRPYGLDLSLIADRTVNELHNSRHHVLVEHLLAEPQTMWVFDCYTYPAEEAAKPFEARLSFQAIRKGKCNALAAWFHADFAHDIRLTNAPHAPKTHWGRTLLPLSQTTEVDMGTLIKVDIACIPVGFNDCDNRWAVQIADGEWQEYRGRQACIRSLGFH